MQQLEEVSKEMQDLYRKVVGKPAPPIGSEDFFPFPPGVDPVQHAMAEVRTLGQMFNAMSSVPRPASWIPLADTFLKTDEWLIRLDLPGVSREDIEVMVVGDECVVRGERTCNESPEELRPVNIERSWGHFERRIPIPVRRRGDDVKARLADGVLELRVPLVSSAAPREKKIELN